MKILIVEDEPALQELVQRTLEQERFVVEVASTYAEAAVKMGAYDYDCILLDIMLPDGSGLDLLAQLKQMHKQVSRKTHLDTALTQLYLQREELEQKMENWKLP